MEKLLEVLSIQSVSHDQWRMFAYIIRQLQHIPNVSYTAVDGNIYIQRGIATDYPCVVAHMDTVHDIVEDLHPIVFNGLVTGFNRVAMEQTGIGGDDKVGVYIALECLRSFDNIKVAFFRDEEIGCMGSYVANMQFFEDCRFVLQCDRRGNSDFITTASGVELSSKAFQDAVLPIINSYDYKFAAGMMTDVMALKQNGIGCSVANMSCGYYNPHQPNEFVDVWEVEACLDMCKTIISRCTDVYVHKYKPSYSYTKPSTKYKWQQATNKAWDWDAPKENNTLGWDDWDYGYPSKKKIHSEDYCADCWSAPAESHGLCKTCLSWYEYTNREDNDIII